MSSVRLRWLVRGDEEGSSPGAGGGTHQEEGSWEEGRGATVEGGPWGAGAGKVRQGDPGSSQPHQLQPLFEFNEWILASEAREAETSPPPRPAQPSPALPHPHSHPPLPRPLLPRGPSRHEGGGQRVGGGTGCKRGRGVRWERGGAGDEMTMKRACGGATRRGRDGTRA